MEHAYQKMSICNFQCMFRYRLKYIETICVQEYVYMTSSYTGPWGGSFKKPPHPIFLSSVYIFFCGYIYP
jgi:hypothetical protein